MDYIRKKGVLPLSVCGYVILRATQSVVNGDDDSEFLTESKRNGFEATRRIPSAGLELTVFTMTEDPIDTRESYGDFFIVGKPFYTGKPDGVIADMNTVGRRAEAFRDEIVDRIDIYRWVKVPELEYRACDICDGIVIWSPDEKLWECNLHGFIAENLTSMRMKDPF